MKTVILKSLVLLFSIPLLNSVAFGIGTLFHDIYPAHISESQFVDYQISMVLLISLVGLSILLIETAHEYWLKSHRTSTLLYLFTFACMAFFTREQFIFRPFEHGLTMLCIGTILITRIWLQKLETIFLRKQKPQFQT